MYLLAKMNRIELFRRLFSTFKCVIYLLLIQTSVIVINVWDIAKILQLIYAIEVHGKKMQSRVCNSRRNNIPSDEILMDVIIFKMYEFLVSTLMIK